MQYFQKLIQKDLGFGHTLDTPIASHDRADIWSFHHGTNKETSEPVLVLHYDPARQSNSPLSSSRGSLSKTGLMRLKTLRHPDILKYLSSVEGTDGTIYVATEPATPLATILVDNPSALDRETVQWGLFTVSRALAFMHTSGLIHARLNPSTIFVTPNGDWKLGGLECVTAHAQAASLSQNAGLQLQAYQSPEFARGNWSSVASAVPSAVDSWALGCLMYEAHAGSLNSPEQLQNVSVLPKPLLSAYQKFLASNPSMRAPAGELPNHPYFQKSKFVELNMFVENLALKGQLEREAFLSKLPNIMDRLPDGFCTFKVLPMLSQSMETGSGGSAAFSCIVKMKDRLSEVDFTKNVVNKYAIGWFTNPNLDRNLRVELYNNLNLFVKHVDDSVLNTKIFPGICTSFQDMQAPALRDATVKSILSICDRLSEKNLNSALMSHFAKLQVDPEPAIRTNTTVCLGKIAPKLNQAARNKVLAAAFLRSLKDPFPPARAAGVNAILTTCDMYSIRDIATRLLPVIVTLLVDPAGDVRGLSFKVLDSFQKKLTKNHEEMTQAEEVAAANGSRSNENMAMRSGSNTSGASSGWSLSSFSSMTAALLNTSKTDKPTSSSTATGISSEDFRAGRVVPSGSKDSMRNTNGNMPAMKPVTATTATSSDVWGMSGSGSSVAPAAATGPPPVIGNGLGGSFSDMNSFNDLGDDLVEDEDEDGWGDMDIKTDSKPMDDEDIFGSIMGGPPVKPKAVPGGLSKPSMANKPPTTSAEDDLWSLAPPMVSKPKPRTTQNRTTTLGGTSRRTKKSGGDDWEALLGGTGPTTRRKTGTRKGGL